MATAQPQPFPALLRSHRETAGKTLREVAEKLKVDVSLISKWERGERKPTRTQVNALAKYLKTDSKTLLTAWLRDAVVYAVGDDELALDAIKAAEAQVVNMIATQTISRQGGDISYQFIDGGKIKKLYVTAAQSAQLARGQIAIVRHGEAYELVPTLVAEKIATRDASRVVVLNTRAETAAADEDDPYKDYVIPDDLMW